jgi:NAD(P)H-hydrate repair Nnr-like enzyme with NAD(P)H-hydrate dehydratase domain
MKGEHCWISNVASLLKSSHLPAARQWSRSVAIGWGIGEEASALCNSKSSLDSIALIFASILLIDSDALMGGDVDLAAARPD